MTIYLDTSFLVSLYSPDGNTGTAIRLMGKSGEKYVMTGLVEFETENALQLRVFRAEISATQAQAACDKLALNRRAGAFEVRPWPIEAFARALQLSHQTTAKLGTRSADVLHIASALELGCAALYSFDERQRKLARAVHLRVN